MMNKKVLKLPEKYSDILENYPENGMGYHIVIVELINGKILTNRIVLNSSFLQLKENESYTVNDIKNITLK